MKLLKIFNSDEGGQTLVEYGLIVALLAIAAIAILATLSGGGSKGKSDATPTPKPGGSIQLQQQPEALASDTPSYEVYVFVMPTGFSDGVTQASFNPGDFVVARIVMDRDSQGAQPQVDLKANWSKRFIYDTGPDGLRTDPRTETLIHQAYLDFCQAQCPLVPIYTRTSGFGTFTSN
ncbi:MAG TPA: hypothetical protein VG965_02385 [Patescibacteria group bacterium]|nr:hypothetical protein [Patescibacteria group bacterium]